MFVENQKLAGLTLSYVSSVSGGDFWIQLDLGSAALSCTLVLYETEGTHASMTKSFGSIRGNSCSYAF
jgi:hypothetical protein